MYSYRHSLRRRDSYILSLLFLSANAICRNFSISLSFGLTIPSFSPFFPSPSLELLAIHGTIGLRNEPVGYRGVRRSRGKAIHADRNDGAPIVPLTR